MNLIVVLIIQKTNESTFVLSNIFIFITIVIIIIIKVKTPPSRRLLVKYKNIMYLLFQIIHTKSYKDFKVENMLQIKI